MSRVVFDVLVSTAQQDRRARKRAGIVAAATEVFLSHGYSGASMNDITERAAVSKQTVYAYFPTKEALFVEVVSSMTRVATANVQATSPELPAPGEVAGWLETYFRRQLTVVLDPDLLRLRRLTISEAERFPDLARALWDEGPARAMTALAGHLRALCADGHLVVDNPTRAAEQLNWLVMGQPLNAAMLLGSIPTARQIAAHVRASVATFLAAYAADRATVSEPGTYRE